MRSPAPRDGRLPGQSAAILRMLEVPYLDEVAEQLGDTPTRSRAFVRS